MRIANAAGFWGDRNDVLREQVRGGPVDVVMLDYLAEVTMAILRRKRMRDPDAGYASDFIAALELALDDVVERGVSVVTNAGGMNPHACAQAVAALARRRGHTELGIGVVSGDDLMEELDGLAAQGASLAHLDTGEPLSAVRERVMSANAYLGAEPVAEALRQGAQIVVTGRCTDSALALGPLLARYGWRDDDWDRRAAGIVAGHVIECGGQASGGNFCGAWEQVPDLANLGYPIAEVEEDGTVVITKHEALGGLVTGPVIKEQLLYEIHDPRAYVTPDVVADFTSIALDDLGDNRVRLAGMRGAPPPDTLKVSITFEAGWSNVVSIGFPAPDAMGRARAAADLLLARAQKRGLQIDEHRVDFVGVNAAHGPMAPAPDAEPNEVLLRVAIRSGDRDSARAFAHEVAPLITSGIPGAFRGMTAGRAEPQRLIDHWPTLVSRQAVQANVEVIAS